MSLYRLVAGYTGPSREAWELLSGLEPVKKAAKTDASERAVELDTSAAIERAATWLKTQPTKRIGVGEGSDNFCLGLAYWLRDMGISEWTAPALIAEHWAARCPDKWDPEFIELKVTNAYKHAQNKSAGRDAVAPAATTFAHYAGIGGADRAAAEGDYAPLFYASQPLTKRPKPSVWTSGNITQAEPPRIPEIIPGVLEEHMVKMIEGEKSAHKSRLLLYDLAHIVAGLPCYGADSIMRCHAIYLNYENPLKEMNWRRWAAQNFLRRTNQDPPLDLSNLYVADLHDEDTALLDVNREGQITLTSFMRELIERLDRNAQAGHYTILGIDGFFDAVRMPDMMRNESLVARDVIRFFERLCVDYNLSIEALIHPTRSASRAKVQGSYAGTWTNRPRGFDTMAKDPKLNDVFARTIVKRSHGKQGRKFLFEYYCGTLRPAIVVNQTSSEPPHNEVE